MKIYILYRDERFNSGQYICNYYTEVLKEVKVDDKFLVIHVEELTEGGYKCI